MKKFFYTFLIIYIYNCQSLSSLIKKKDDNHPPKKDDKPLVTPDNKQKVDPPIVDDKKQKFVVCFWNVKNLSDKGLDRDGKGIYIIQFIPKCDIIGMVEIRSAKIDMANLFEEKLKEAGFSYDCEEGDSKGSGSRKEKALVCIKKKDLSSVEKDEFEDNDGEFSRPPTFFHFTFKKKGFVIVPFHSTPGSKEELVAFQKVVDSAIHKYPGHNYFFGGDFNTGTNYQSANFLKSINYFNELAQLISAASTFAKQSHDLVFVERKNEKNCKGIVWRLDELFPDVGGRKELEKISDHFPVGADCNF